MFLIVQDPTFRLGTPSVLERAHAVHPMHAMIRLSNLITA